jgi:hypothetical protein
MQRRKSSKNKKVKPDSFKSTLKGIGVGGAIGAGLGAVPGALYGSMIAPAYGVSGVTGGLAGGVGGAIGGAFNPLLLGGGGLGGYAAYRYNKKKYRG